ncbi:MAG: hypothetical protein WCO12_00475 [bacterium]
MQDFKYTKFRKANDTSYIIRNTFSNNGCPVIFRVSGIDLSTLKSSNKFPDFDQESDSILENLEVNPGTGQVYFQWVGNSFHRM